MTYDYERAPGRADVRNDLVAYLWDGTQLPYDTVRFLMELVASVSEDQYEAACTSYAADARVNDGWEP